MRKFFAVLAFLLAGAAIAETWTLTVEIAGLRSKKGYIELGLYDNPDGFPKEDEDFAKARVEVDSTHVIMEFEGLPQGEYAIAFYHDENADGKFNKNFLGIPREGYGFSNDARPKLSAPSFDECAFSIDGDTTITITIVY
ncbi:MAG TPA: DUF2141 domain-containing protein [candidate division Zixibacteria bacterium]|nr:DUF2141 domain-containing protein [candidate division Zixibacteria bacterium]